MPDRDTDTADAIGDRLTPVIEGLYASTAALGTDGPARRAAELAALIMDATRNGEN